MASITVKTTKGAHVQAELGSLADAFLPMFDNVVADLAKPDGAARRLGGPPECARAFVYCIERLVAGEELPAEWTIWCGAFAATRSAETLKKAMTYLVVLDAVLASVPFFLRGRHNLGDLRQVFSIGAFIFLGALIWLWVSVRGWLKYRSVELPSLPTALAEHIKERAEAGGIPGGE
jgi:hypothetical protein